MKRLTIIIAACALVAAGCGDDDDDDSSGEQTSATTSASSVQTCIDSWNEESNEALQTALAGAISASGADPEALQVGTWPKSERTVDYRSGEDAFGDVTGQATVPTDACLIIVPPSQAGDLAYFEADGKWHFVIRPADEPRGEKFQVAAERLIAGAETATVDALGKLSLGENL